jgi:hypothetical protein
MIDKLLKYVPLTLLVTVLFSAGGLWVKFNNLQNIIEDKLDRKEFERIRERDSLRQIIKDLELVKIKREINPPPETTKQRDTTTIIK